LSALIDGPKTHGVARITCPRCGGTGEFDPPNDAWAKIGGTHRTWRVAQHEGLAACAERLGLDPRDLSDMEHGRRDPGCLLADIPQVLRDHEQLPPLPNKAA
jgi:hypothetical protein